MQKERLDGSEIQKIASGNAPELDVVGLNIIRIILAQKQEVRFLF